MRYKRLGNSGEKVPVVGLGTWKITVKSRTGVTAIRRGIELGARFVDTAEMYNNESMVGKAISKEKVFVATKVSPNHFHYDDVIRSCKASLSRLKIRRIDLYQLHWPNRSIPIEETMRAMEHLADLGLIRHIGVSNFSVKELSDAQSVMKRYEIVSNQVEYSPFAKDVEHGLTDFCKREKVTVIAYSPLARGHVFRSYRGSEVLSELAERYGRSVSQIVLNYLISKGNTMVIPKSENVRHVEENVGAADFRMSKNDIEAIDIVGERISKPLAGRIMQALLKKNGVWAGFIGTGKDSESATRT